MNELGDEDLAAELRRRGFEVKKKIQYVKQGIEIDVVVFEHFKAYCKKHKLKLKIAITEAVKDWLVSKIEARASAPKKSSASSNAS